MNFITAHLVGGGEGPMGVGGRVNTTNIKARTSEQEYHRVPFSTLKKLAAI